MSIMTTNINTESWFDVRRSYPEYLKYGKTVWRPGLYPGVDPDHTGEIRAFHHD